MTTNSDLDTTNTRRTITKAQFENLREQLRAMPKKPKTEFTPREIVFGMAEEIHRLVTEDGYSFADVAQMLKQGGVTLKAPTIRSYLHEHMVKAAPPSPKKRNAKQGTAARQFERNPDAAESQSSVKLVFRDLTDDDDDSRINPSVSEAGNGHHR